MSSLRSHGLLIPLIAGTILVTTMGPSCPIGILVPVDTGPVTVELTNNTGQLVPPLLYADPATLYSIDNVVIPDNFVNIGPPLEPGETASVELACEDAGTLYSDANFIILPDGSLLGPDNLLREGDDYFCGDTITMSYELPVTVELFNNTSNVVDAFLWADPSLRSNPEDVAIDANEIDIGPPLDADEVATITLDCVDAGTLLADGDLRLEPSGTLRSSNYFLLNEGGSNDFMCGDRVDFNYEVDGTGDFFMTAEVNGAEFAP